jgi:hypothetical protein
VPTPQYTALATTTLVSSASSVTFSSISGSYRDLLLIAQPKSSSTIGIVVRFNSDSGANYSFVRMNGNGSSATSNSYTSQTSIDLADSLAAGGDSGIMQIMDYSATDKHKTVLVRSDSPSDVTRAIVGRWANTSAITTVAVTTSGTMLSGTTLSLYGVK